jgi:hypothetical protein
METVSFSEKLSESSEMELVENTSHGTTQLTASSKSKQHLSTGGGFDFVETTAYENVLTSLSEISTSPGGDNESISVANTRDNSTHPYTVLSSEIEAETVDSYNSSEDTLLTTQPMKGSLDRSVATTYAYAEKDRHSTLTEVGKGYIHTSFATTNIYVEKESHSTLAEVKQGVIDGTVATTYMYDENGTDYTYTESNRYFNFRVHFSCSFFMFIF